MSVTEVRHGRLLPLSRCSTNGSRRWIRATKSLIPTLTVRQGLQIHRSIVSASLAQKRGNMDAFQTSGTSPTPQDGSDFRCENHGSFFRQIHTTTLAHLWIQENIPPDHSKFGSGVVLEHRHVWAVLEYLQSDGLVVRR